MRIIGEDRHKRPAVARRVQRERGEEKFCRRGHWVAPEPEGAEDSVKPAVARKGGERIEVRVLIDGGRRRERGGREKRGAALLGAYGAEQVRRPRRALGRGDLPTKEAGG